MINVRQISKSYGNLQALKSVSFKLSEGELFGLLGPNGAGKTTTISILSTLLKPDTGTVEMAGIDLLTHPMDCKRIIGVVPQEISLYEELSAWENLLFWGSLYGLKRSILKEKATEVLKLMGLHDRKEDKISSFSGGMKRRINIASALLHSPRILFMDEPTVGIDPQSRNLIYEVIEQLHKQGVTLIYTTHYMQEAERLCDRIGIIDQGEIIAMGTLEELRNNSTARETLVFECEKVEKEKIEQLRKGLNREIQVTGTQLSIVSQHARADLPPAIAQMNELGLKIQHIDIREINLETVFLELTGRKLRD